VKKLSGEALIALRNAVSAHSRPLEAAQFSYLIGESSVDPILQELSPFQNSDGGFGHGLEPDFWLPDSSSMATSMAFRVLVALPVDATLPMILRGMDYYEATFQPQRQQWEPTGPAVNHYPHAPWWDMNEEATAAPSNLDASQPLNWDGNPSAEILSHFLKYRDNSTRVDVEALVNLALTHLKRQEHHETHEIQCYLKLFGQLSSVQQTEILPVLQRAVLQLVEADTRQWGNYVPKPLDFVHSPASPLYPALEELVNVHLDYLVSEVEQNGLCTPTWDWGYDAENWQKAKQMWSGILTCGCVSTLKAFGRIEEI
jgi:hypothetical protein